MHKLTVLTNSAVTTFRRCAREFYYAYILLCRALTQPEPLRFGTLLHLGLEAWWKAKQRSWEGSFAGVAALEAMRAHAHDDFELARAGALIIGYDARWGDTPYEVISVEGLIVTPLVHPHTGEQSPAYELGMKLDVLVRDPRDGRVKVIEHKSSAEDISLGSTYWQALKISSQLSTYIAGAKADGYDVEEVVYDVIGKPELRPKGVPLTDAQGAKIVHDANGERVRTAKGKWRETGDTALGYVVQTRPETSVEFHARIVAEISSEPEAYYRRGVVVRLEAEEQEAALDLWQTAEMISEAEAANRWPRNPGACIRFKRPCTYFDVCTGSASISDPALYRVAETAHEELALEAAE